MKKIIYTLILLLAPSALYAVEMPVGTVGVSEATYAHITTATCTYEEYGGCDDVIESLDGKIISRVDANGELYQVQVGDGAAGPVLRYIPDGFYRVGKKVYHANSGLLVRIKRGSAYKTLRRVARSSVAVGVSNADLGYLINPEHACDGNESCAAYWLNRVSELEGSILLDVDTANVFYVKNNPNSGMLMPVSKKVGKKSLFRYMQKNAEVIQSAVIDDMTALTGFTK